MIVSSTFKVLLCFMVSIMISMVTRSQLPDYQLSRVLEQEGLKTSDVINMAKDKEGFLWLASQSHVQRFDGRHTDTYTFNETITAVFVDAPGRKWVTTREAVYLFAGRQGGFKHVSFEKEQISTGLYEGTNGSVFAIGSGGHFLYDNQQQKFIQQSSPLSNSGLKATRYFGKHAETFFFGAGDTLIQYNIATRKSSSVKLPRIYSVIPLNGDQVLVSNYRFETFHIDFRRNEITLMTKEWQPVLQGKTNIALHGGIQVPGNRWLVSSNMGLFSFSPDSNTVHRPAFYYEGRPLGNLSSVTSFYQDQHGDIYMNHADGVFFMNNRGGFIYLLRDYQSGNEKLLANDTRNFAEDEQGYIWMATTHGIGRLNMHTGDLKVSAPVKRDNSIDYPSYRQLLNEGKYMWIGTSGNGVWLYDKTTDTYRRPGFVSSNESEKESDFFQTYVWKLLKLQDGRILIVGGNRNYIVDPVTLIARQIFIPQSGNVARSAIQDSAGRIWRGSTRGLVCMNDKFETLFTLVDSLPDKRVASLCEWKQNKMLVGSKGLFEIETDHLGKIISFSEKKGIPATRLVYCMKKDAHGYVWMGTDDGIIRYDPVKDESISFDHSDNVQSQAFNSDAIFISRSGLMFVGGKNGVNYFNPSLYALVDKELKPMIASFSVADQYRGCDTGIHNIEVPYGDGNIDFVISAPEFNRPFALQYRYRLNDGENGWTSMGFSNRMRISSLSPGLYRLEVSASYDGRTWFDSNDVVMLTVLKPWWQTWWFRLLCFFAIAFVIWSFMYYRQKRKENREMKQAIGYFTDSLTEHASTELILWDIVRNCIARLGFEDCVIYLLDEKRKVLVQKAAYGAKNPAAFEISNPIEIEVGKGITGHVAATGKTLLIDDTSKDDRYIVDDQRRFSELAVPIVHDGKVIGVIDSEHRKKRYFTRHHVKTLETIASICSSKIATAMAIEATKKAESELLVLNGKMMESKFLNLRLQMNPHFLFNILTSIQYQIVSGQVSKATSNLNTFSQFLRSLLNYAEETVVTLEEELRVLGMYVELESICLDETFNWQVNVDEEIDQEEVLVPFMLLQPFVENAINHGLVHRVGEKRFAITVKENDQDSLNFIIEDNGIGRQAAMNISRKNLSGVIHPSKGIGIVRKRLELLQQKTSKPAGFEITDIYQDEKAMGTCVNIVIPYYSKEET